MLAGRVAARRSWMAVVAARRDRTRGRLPNLRGAGAPCAKTRADASSHASDAVTGTASTVDTSRAPYGAPSPTSSSPNDASAPCSSNLERRVCAQERAPDRATRLVRVTSNVQSAPYTNGSGDPSQSEAAGVDDDVLPERVQAARALRSAVPTGRQGSGPARGRGSPAATSRRCPGWGCRRPGSRPPGPRRGGRTPGRPGSRPVAGRRAGTRRRSRTRRWGRPRRAAPGEATTTPTRPRPWSLPVTRTLTPAR